MIRFPGKLFFVVAAALAVGFASAAPGVNAVEQKWGDLTGQFVYAGKPVAKPLKVDKDAQVCGKVPLVDESLVVNPQNQGLANVVVWLQTAEGTKLAAHPDYAAALNEPVKVDNKGCRFEPHISFVRTGQKLVVANADAVGHNTMLNTVQNPASNMTVPVGGKIDMTYKNLEDMPVTISCSAHPWMTARLVVKDHPYVAISDKDGKFTLKNLPAGEWTFRVWHESGWVKELSGTPLVSGKLKGAWKYTVKEGANDAGKFTVKLQDSE